MKNNSGRMLSLVLVGVFALSALAIGVYFGVRDTRAYTEELPPLRHTPVFTRDEYRLDTARDVATRILSELEDAGYDIANDILTQGQLLDVLGLVHLFETVHLSGGGLPTSAPTTTEQFVANMTRQRWRPVYFRNGIMTLWMEGSYRNSLWNNRTDPTFVDDLYNNFNSTMEHFTDFASFLIRPNDLPYNWHLNQHSAHAPTRFTFPISDGDTLFVPSLPEIEDNGIWGFQNAASRQPNALGGGNTPGALNPAAHITRCGLTTNNNMWRLGQGGTFDSSAGPAQLTGLRPAVHLDIMSLARQAQIRFNSQGGQPSTISAQVVEHGDFVVRPTNPTREGYTFSHWHITPGGPEWTRFRFEDPVWTSAELHSVWRLNQNWVTFDTLGAMPMPAPQLVGWNEFIYEPEDPYFTGATFSHWSETRGGPAFNFAMPMPDRPITLFAVYNEGGIPMLTVTIFISGSQTTTYMFSGGRVVQPPDPTIIPYGMRFGHWSAVANGPAFTFGQVATSNFHLHAVFVAHDARPPITQGPGGEWPAPPSWWEQGMPWPEYLLFPYDPPLWWEPGMPWPGQPDNRPGGPGNGNIWVDEDGYLWLGDTQTWINVNNPPTSTPPEFVITVVGGILHINGVSTGVNINPTFTLGANGYFYMNGISTGININILLGGSPTGEPPQPSFLDQNWPWLLAAVGGIGLLSLLMSSILLLRRRSK